MNKQIKDIKQGLNKAKEIVGKTNEELLKASEQMIDDTVKAAEKWQKLAMKALKDSEPIRANQQKMLFDAAAELKKQFEDGSARMKDIFGAEETIEKAKEAGKSVKKAANKATTKAMSKPAVQKAMVGAMKVQEEVKKQTSKAKKTISKATKVAEPKTETK